METLVVGLGSRSYEISISCNSLSLLGEHVRQINFPRTVVIVSNTTVFPLYGRQVTETLADAGFSVKSIIVDDGEEYKTSATLDSIYTQLIQLGCDRHTGIVALGGGVVGDMAGYAAATYLRGIPFIQVPTTLLSQVDSSVGGKTAINHPLGKNLIGAFYQPKYVHIDIATLKTLSKRDYLAGIAEVVKYGVVFDGDFFTWLEENVDRILRQDVDALTYAITRSCAIKADIVEKDETENSVRAILNYGHTFGHAVEHLSGYGQVLHGEAVSMGMVVAAKISHQLHLCSIDDVQRIETLLQEFGLPVTPPDFSVDEYVAAMSRDKKVKEGVLRMVLNHGIGESKIVEVDDPVAYFQCVLL